MIVLSEDFLNQIFRNRQEEVEKKIQKEYHRRIKEIKEIDEEERNNIKMGIISELYYKEGFKEGINFISNYIQKI
jgi:demethoxyubiquinone hydroxylase (CLK1/Coq7/Cat5 family)